MTIGATDKVCRFVEVGGGIPAVLLGSQALRWTMPRLVLGDVSVLHGLYLATRPSHVWVDVGRQACPLHRPMVCNHQTRG
jgi:hypothetical protein